MKLIWHKVQPHYSTVPKYSSTWWRHQVETFSALLDFCAGNSPVTGEFPAQRPVTRTFGVFFDLRLNKRLSKQSWGWWFETPLRPLWRHCNETHHSSPVSVSFVSSKAPCITRACQLHVFLINLRLENFVMLVMYATKTKHWSPLQTFRNICNFRIRHSNGGASIEMKQNYTL